MAGLESTAILLAQLESAVNCTAPEIWPRYNYDEVRSGITTLLTVTGSSSIELAAANNDSWQLKVQFSGPNFADFELALITL